MLLLPDALFFWPVGTFNRGAQRQQNKGRQDSKPVFEESRLFMTLSVSMVCHQADRLLSAAVSNMEEEGSMTSADGPSKCLVYSVLHRQTYETYLFLVQGSGRY